MMNPSFIPALMNRLIPGRMPAMITLNPDTTPIVINVQNAWIMIGDGGLDQFGKPFLETQKNVIKFMDSEFNAAGLGYEVRARDTILFAGQLYRVSTQGGNLTTMLTTWEVDVQKEFPSI